MRSQPIAPSPPFPPQIDRGERRCRVSDERLREFAKLTPYERLKWVEDCSTFVRIGQQAMARQTAHVADRQGDKLTVKEPETWQRFRPNPPR
ncbi:hypothetical protein OPEN69S_01596 [Ottowia pentelensis]